MLREKSTYHWREGMPHPKRDLILMRFATNSDKKTAIKIPEHKVKKDYNEDNINNLGKNPWGDLCRSWGVYDHQEVFQRKLPKIDFEEDNPEEQPALQIKNKRLAMRLGKRRFKVESDNESSSSDSEWKMKSKTPRMRMHADDEESKQRKQNLPKQYTVEEDDGYAPLSIEVINSRSMFTPRETRVSDKFRFKDTTRQEKDSRINYVQRNIQSRLGVKVAPDEHSSSSDESSSNDSDHNIMSRVQKITSTSKNFSDVWSRLESKPQMVAQKDLRQILTTRKHKSDDHKHESDDLREKLGKTKQCNLRIEIDNNYADE